MALPACLRFPHRRDIRSVLARGRRVQTPLGWVAVRPAAARPGRVLFVVSTAVARRSSDRHRIQRRLDAWVLAGGLAALGRFDLVVHVDRRAASARTRALVALAEGMSSSLLRALDR